MTATLRDPWEDARLVVTEDVLDDDLVRVRRRASLRQALLVLIGAAALIAAILVGDALAGPSFDDHWRPTLQTIDGGFALEVVGFVLMMVGAFLEKRAGAGSFLRPESLLGRSDRTWLRHQIDDGAPVPPERKQVAVAVARRMTADSASLPRSVGLVLVCLGLAVGAVGAGFVVVPLAVAAWTIAGALRDQVRSRRARTWLARNA